MAKVKSKLSRDEQLRNSVILKQVTQMDMEELVKAHLVGNGSQREEEENPGSKQIADDPFQSMAAGEFVAPKYNPSVWAAAMEQNTRLSRSIRTYARNTVGLGWYIEPIHKVTDKTPGPDRKLIEKQTKELHDLLDEPNEDMPFTQVMNLVKIDEEATGNGYLEAVRNMKGDISGLYHAPSVTMRVRKIKAAKPEDAKVDGFVQIRGSQKRYFKKFGDRRVINAITGEVYSGSKAMPMALRATEIIHFKVYSPTSSYYGAPRYVSASAAISGNRLASLRNVSFFDNDAVPRMAILVSGGRLTGESMAGIEDFFRAKARGVQEAHRCLIVQVEPQKVGFQQESKINIDMRPLTVGVTEDASFQTYRDANDNEVREVFGIAPVFFQTENVNKASASTSREITNEQEFEPDRLEKEYIFNQTVVAAMFKHDARIRFRFERLQLTDPLDKARMEQIYAGLGAVTPNELREGLGKGKFPKEFLFGDKPLAIAMAELSRGLAMAILGGTPVPTEHLADKVNIKDDKDEDGEKKPGAEAKPKEKPAEVPVQQAPVGSPDVAPTVGGVGVPAAMSIAQELMRDAREMIVKGTAFVDTIRYEDSDITTGGEKNGRR